MHGALGRMMPGVKRFGNKEVPKGLRRHTVESNYGRCEYTQGGIHYGFLNKDGICHRCARQERPERKSENTDISLPIEN